MLAAIGGLGTIDGESKGDTYEPSLEASTVAQFIEAAVGAQNRVLGDVFGVGSVAQDAASYAESERAAFGEAFFKFAAQGAFGNATLKIGLRCATWLAQNQLLHR